MTNTTNTAVAANGSTIRIGDAVALTDRHPDRGYRVLGIDAEGFAKVGTNRAFRTVRASVLIAGLHHEIATPIHLRPRD